MRDEEFSREEMADIIADIPKSGSELLREQDEWHEKVETIYQEKRKTTRNAVIPATMLTLISYINYDLWKNPPSKKPYFSEYLFKPISGRTLSRSIAAIFFVILGLQTGQLAYRHYRLSEDIEEAQSKIDLLGRFADREDAIEKKKRMLDHYLIARDILMESCPSPSLP